MSLDEAVRRSVEGVAGKLLLGSAFTIIMAISGVAYHKISAVDDKLSEHSSQLSSFGQKLDDFITVENNRAAATQTAIEKLAGDDQQRSIAIARAEEDIEQLKGQPPRIVREVVPASPQPQSLGDALSHIFQSPHHRRR